MACSFTAGEYFPAKNLSGTLYILLNDGKMTDTPTLLGLPFILCKRIFYKENF